MRIFTVKRLLGALLFISTQVSADFILLDESWEPVKNKKAASFYLKQPVEVKDGQFKVELY